MVTSMPFEMSLWLPVSPNAWARRGQFLVKSVMMGEEEEQDEEEEGEE